MEHSSRLLWITGVFFGWYAVIAHGLAWHGRRTLRHLLDAPLSDEVEATTRFWDQCVTLWTPQDWSRQFSRSCASSSGCLCEAHAAKKPLRIPGTEALGCRCSDTGRAEPCGGTSSTSTMASGL